jgi:hypothetical protein
VIVAIVKQTDPSGQVPVEEFRSAANGAAAVTAFVNEYSPPLNESDYLGFETADPSAPAADPGNVWAYDFDAPGLVQMPEDQTGTLTDLKKWKIAAIDARTEALLLLGYEYPPASNKKFGLDLAARTLLLGLVLAKDVLTYPVRYNTLDGLDYYDLVDATDVVNFYGTAVATVRAQADAGTALKDAVRAATTKAAVIAVVDNR